MEQGYGKRELIIKISPDTDSLITKLLDISEKATDLSATARSLVRTIKEDTEER